MEGDWRVCCSLHCWLFAFKSAGPWPIANARAIWPSMEPCGNWGLPNLVYIHLPTLWLMLSLWVIRLFISNPGVSVFCQLPKNCDTLTSYFAIRWKKSQTAPLPSHHTLTVLGTSKMCVYIYIFFGLFIPVLQKYSQVDTKIDYVVHVSIVLFLILTWA